MDAERMNEHEAHREAYDDGYEQALKDVADWLLYLYPTALRAIAEKIKNNDMKREEA